MLNIEKYKDDILNLSLSDLTCCVNTLAYRGQCIKKCIECKKYAMEWLLSEYKATILDDAENKYLSAVIKPFKANVNGRIILQLRQFDECDEKIQ